MNAEPKKNERVSFRTALRQVGKRFLSACSHHWGWKLLSVFLAVCLWAGLITQDPTLTRERLFTDVPVTVTGSDALISNGMVVLSGLEPDKLSIRLRVDVPQRAYSSASAASYNPRIDVSRITETGEQVLRIQTTSSTAYGTVDAISPETVTVVVDEYVTNYRVPVSLNLFGTCPDGFYGTTPLLDPSSVTVSGPKSIVDRVVNLYVDYDVSKLPAREGLVRSALTYRFVDADGKEIASSLLSVTSASVVLRTITVEQRLYPTRLLPVASLALTEGTPAGGYEVKQITAVPENVLAAGDSGALTLLDSLFTDVPVDISGRSESFTVEIPLRRPGGVSYLSTDSVTLEIEIAPVITSQTYSNVRVSQRGKLDKSVVTLSAAKVAVTVTGPKNALRSLSAAQVDAYLELEGLPNGSHTLPVQVEIDSDDGVNLLAQTSPSVIDVTIGTE